jgi:lantibiotic modifying enzyme
MAHGTSGIGLALAALASRTADTGLAEAARAAFAYERRWYDPDAGGWPDLRARSRTGAPGPALTMAWCHGAPGAGLARIHAARLLDDEDLRSETEVALDLTASWVRRSLDAESADFCLCHGLAGNAEILLEGARRLPGAPPSWADLAREAADVGIHRHPGRGRSWPLGPAGEAPSLLTGLAGVGLFLIRLVDARVRSVLVVGTERMTAGPRPGRRHPRSQEVLNAG